MNDEQYDRAYQAARADLNRAIGHTANAIAGEVGKSLTALHRLEWSSPWRAPSAHAGPDSCRT